MNPNPNGKEPGGRGESTHLSPIQENKIVAMMLNPRRRWKITKAAKNEALETTLKNMGDEDGRVRNAAVANLVRMEGQNLQDAHKLLDKQTPSEAASITNQQINIYMPSNGREQPLMNGNGHNGNGKH